MASQLSGFTGHNGEIFDRMFGQLFDTTKTTQMGNHDQQVPDIISASFSFDWHEKPRVDFDTKALAGTY